MKKKTTKKIVANTEIIKEDKKVKKEKKDIGKLIVAIFLLIAMLGSVFAYAFSALAG